MRSPRVVGDYHVDRREVQVQRCTEPTRTNSPITFGSSFRSSLSRHTGSRLGVPEVKSGGDAAGPHLFPFRTEKLSPHAPMVLPGRVGEQAAAAFGGRPLRGGAPLGGGCRGPVSAGNMLPPMCGRHIVMFDFVTFTSFSRDRAGILSVLVMCLAMYP